MPIIKVIGLKKKKKKKLLFCADSFLKGADMRMTAPFPECTHLLSLFNTSTVCWYCPFILLSLLQKTKRQKNTV